MNNLFKDLFKDLFKVTCVTLIISVIVIGIVAGFIAFMQHLAEPSPEQKAAEQVPQLMSETDGCKVYRFVDSGTHYFTRCPATTTTDRNYSERHGKVTVQKTEQIITENK